jgi:ATP synthase protein I
VNSSDQPLEVTPAQSAESSLAATTDAESSDNSMQEYYKLKQELLLITIGIALIVFACVWFFYSLDIALNYLLGAGTSVVYLRMLARNVEQLGPGKRSLGRSQLAIFAGLIIIGTQVNQLRILPIFLGFLTYKATLLVYVLRSAFVRNSS